MIQIPPKVHRNLFLGLTGLALALLAVAVVDHFANDRRLQVPLLVILVTLVVIEIALLIWSEAGMRRRAASSPLEPSGALQTAQATPGAAFPAAGLTHAAAEAGPVPTRVVCPTCQTLFIQELPLERPQPVDCPACSAALNLTHQETVKEWIVAACQDCRTDNRLPAIAALAHFACVACGVRQDMPGLSWPEPAKEAASRPARKAPTASKAPARSRATRA